jgi:hypothetical protein
MTMYSTNGEHSKESSYPGRGHKQAIQLPQLQRIEPVVDQWISSDGVLSNESAESRFARQCTEQNMLCRPRT